MSFLSLKRLSILLAIGIFAAGYQTCEAKKKESLAQSILPVKLVTLRHDGSVKTVWDNTSDSEDAYVLKVLDASAKDVTGSFDTKKLESLLAQSEAGRKKGDGDVAVFYRTGESGLEEVRTRS